MSTFVNLPGGPFCHLTGGVSGHFTGGSLLSTNRGGLLPTYRGSLMSFSGTAYTIQRAQPVIEISAICVSTAIIISTCINSNISISIMQCLWLLGVLWMFQSTCSSELHPYKVATKYLDFLVVSFRGHLRSRPCSPSETALWRGLVWPPCRPHASALAVRGATDSRPGFPVEMACAVRTCRGTNVARR